MSRRRRVIKRPATPDPKYNSTLIAKFISMVMECGKKSVAQRIVYGALETLEQKSQTEGQTKNALELFQSAINNVEPHLEVKTRRVGGANYQVPIEVLPDRRTSLAMRWIIGYARAKPGRSMQDALASELIDSVKGTGSSVKKREDTHRMADANKAFAHFKW